MLLYDYQDHQLAKIATVLLSSPRTVMFIVFVLAVDRTPSAPKVVSGDIRLANRKPIG